MEKYVGNLVKRAALIIVGLQDTEHSVEEQQFKIHDPKGVVIKYIKLH